MNQLNQKWVYSYVSFGNMQRINNNHIIKNDPHDQNYKILICKNNVYLVFSYYILTV